MIRNRNNELTSAIFFRLHHADVIYGLGIRFPLNPSAYAEKVMAVKYEGKIVF